jgi:glycosyltransferase involved in cell wall biosynthesis
MMAGLTSAIVPVSTYDEQNLRQSGIEGNIRLIYNGASDRLGAHPAPVVAERIAAARAEGATIVMSIARLEPPKRFDLFLDVARYAPQNMRFFWIGNARAIPIQPLPSNVEMLGEVLEAGNCINLCDMFLLLSDYEGLPMSILEALSCGKPVVASDVGGVSEALGPNAGLLVPNERAAVLTALERLANDRGLRTQLGMSARAHYEHNFSADSMWRQYLQLYNELSHPRV